MNRKILIFLFIPFLLLTSCNKSESDNKNLDKDFDGLSKDVDKDDNDNTYSFSLLDRTGEEIIESSADTFTMDYRYFVDKDANCFDTNFAKLALLLSSTMFYGTYIDGIKILNNNYSNDESEINPLFVQFGCSNVKFYFHDITDSEIDSRDVGGIVCGEHSFEYKNKKYQVFINGIFPYSKTDEGWFSNFDIGAESEEYTKIYGDSPNWDNKKTHKGFYVSSKRVYDQLKSYLDLFKKDGYEPIVFVCGHSRGGAIANLIGKFLQDDKYKNFTYTSAAPATIANEDQDTLNSYTNIHNIVNIADTVPNLPLKQWDNFSLYGLKYNFSLSGKESEWKEKYKSSYTFTSPEIMTKMTKFINSLSSTRKGVYEFGKETFYESYDNENDALSAKSELLKGFKDNAIAQQLINVFYKFQNNKYNLYYSIRPILVGDMGYQFIQHGFNMEIIEPYLPFLGSYGEEILDTFSTTELLTIYSGFICNHIPKSYFMGLNEISVKDK